VAVNGPKMALSDRENTQFLQGVAEESPNRAANRNWFRKFMFGKAIPAAHPTAAQNRRERWLRTKVSALNRSCLWFTPWTERQP